MSSGTFIPAWSRLFHRSREATPVSPEHQDDLESLFELLRAKVGLESRSDYSDPPDGSQRNRKAFMAHFKELGGLLDEWDATVERVGEAPSALWEWFAQAMKKRGITEPPFSPGSLIDRLAICTVERSKHGQLAVPHDVDIEHMRDHRDGREYVSVYAEGQRVAMLPGEPLIDLEQRVGAADELIQALFDDAQTSEEAREIDHARDSLLRLKQTLLDRLELDRGENTILVATGCPFCQEDREAHAGQSADDS